MTDPVRISAVEIAARLDLPAPTAQQQRIIEAPLQPALVVAGAGSGKTETMAGRVLWLVANGRVRAPGILGLTFTRKAAGQLAERITSRLQALAAAGLVPDYDVFEQVNVATYNSFANSLYRDSAALLGREADGAVLSEASAWQLVRGRVVSSADPRLPALDKGVDAVTKAVFSLGAALSENVADPEQVRAMATRFAALAELPPGSARGEHLRAVALAKSVGSLDVLLDLAAEVAQIKEQRGLIAYSDQVALALAVAERFPQVRAELRNRFRVVLLDEYQDTSVVQTRLLARLFREHPVMAVGDPHQSIYGWRGASSANLDGFRTDFGAGDAATFALSTSWRNGRAILSAANTLVAPLTAHTRVPVQELTAAPNASDVPVELFAAERLSEETDAVARWLKARLAENRDTEPTAALLLRTRKTLPQFLASLREHEVPYAVLGVGGLLQEPEVTDLVCALTVLHDPTAGSELLRLLAGSRWRIGVRDLAELASLAAWLRERDYAGRLLPEPVRAALRSSVASGEDGSLVDALDFFGTAAADHTRLAGFSLSARHRLRDAAATFARLRRRATLDLPELLSVVAQEFLLDIEVEANEARPVGSRNLDALFDALDGYLTVADEASLGGFLSWLREAEFRDDLSPRPEDPVPGSVQVLTIHGAKGLEWDVVAVPRLVEDELPARAREGYQGWLAFGALPYEFRGDAAELPVLDWSAVTTRKELLEAQERFSAEVRERHRAEERRLAYVAVTRAKHALLLSCSFWAAQSTPRGPSEFLTDLAGAGVIPSPPEGSEFAENPVVAAGEPFSWPTDPLGSRRSAVQGAADLVTAAIAQRSAATAQRTAAGGAGTDARADPGIGTDARGLGTAASAADWERDLELLLAERRQQEAGPGPVQLPVRIPASRFQDYIRDPAARATSLRRPVPERPYRATRLGTLFHSWVENRSGMAGAGEGIDEPDVFEADAAGEARLEELQAVFERSEWGALRPVEVELEIHLPFAGQIVICKIDAVYRRGERYQIVDWKTGQLPRDPAERELKQLQLALYRIAYATWKGIDPAEIDACLYYVAEDRVVRPERSYSLSELRALWSRVT